MVQLRDAKQESGKELLFEPRLEEELTGQVKRKMDELLMDDPSAILLHVPPPLKASRTLKCKSRTKRKQQVRKTPHSIRTRITFCQIAKVLERKGGQDFERFCREI